MGRKMPSSPDLGLNSVPRIVAAISQSTCFLRQVSLPMSTTVTVESLKCVSDPLGHLVSVEIFRNVPYPHGSRVHSVVNIGEEAFEPVSVALVILVVITDENFMAVWHCFLGT